MATRVNTTEGGAMPAAAPTVCRVAMMGRELAELHIAFDRSEEAGILARSSSDAARNSVENRRQEIIHARRRGLEEMMSWHCAASLEGALHQVLVATGDAAEVQYSDSDLEELRIVGRRLRRLLFSIRRVIEDASGLKALEVCGDFYASESGDPLIGRAEVLA